MYNSQKPSVDDLPSAAQLLKSTIIAAVSAVGILTTIVLPAEYGIDPTGIGRVLGLTEMGEIKSQLAKEREQDQQAGVTSEDLSSVIDNIKDLFAISAHAQETNTWSDEVTFTLIPGEGIEWKLVMNQGAVAQYQWITNGGRVNFDLHGDGSGNSITYEKGRGQTDASGTITAAFNGNHGWFWRNRDNVDVTITLQLQGEYSELKQTY